jgi:hypothetical protein
MEAAHTFVQDFNHHALDPPQDPNPGPHVDLRLLNDPRPSRQAHASTGKNADVGISERERANGRRENRDNAAKRPGCARANLRRIHVPGAPVAAAMCGEFSPAGRLDKLTCREADVCSVQSRPPRPASPTHKTVVVDRGIVCWTAGTFT